MFVQSSLYVHGDSNLRALQNKVKKKIRSLSFHYQKIIKFRIIVLLVIFPNTDRFLEFMDN